MVENRQQLLGEDELELNELRVIEDIEESIDVFLGMFETLLSDFLDSHSFVELESVREVRIRKQEEKYLDLGGWLPDCPESNLK